VSDNPVRDIHDAVARNADPVVASTRPATTAALEMRRMVADVIAKLRPGGASVIELGCGTGVLGVPIARRASRYVGVDISPRAVEVLRERLPGSTIRCADVTHDDLSDLGTFDRLLVYAALHYVVSEADGERFVRGALAMLAPGGRALFGNLPMPAGDLPHSTWQRAVRRAWTGGRRVLRGLHRQPMRPNPLSMPTGYCLPLSRALIESWLHGVPGVRWQWLAPGLGVPLARTRADLLVFRKG
jgi:SAM-dependent methyltransferase